MKLSIVSPVYKAENIVKELVVRIHQSVQPITDDYEVILVEDGSQDNSWAAIEEECRTDGRVKGIKLTRNFGQHYAITAGLAHSTGDFTVVMDCDLQDNPEDIPRLLEATEKGFDIVYTRKKKREHSFLKNLTAWIFNALFNWLVDNANWRSFNNIGTFSLITSKVVKAFNQYNDYRRHYLMILRWLGFNSTIIQVEHSKRFEGKSSYTLGKLLTHAIDGITTQSDKLLRFTIGLGFLLSCASFIGVIYIVLSSFVSL